MRIVLSVLLAGAFLSTAGFAQDANEAVFKYQGKDFRVSDLPTSTQQMIFEVNRERYVKLQQVADQAILEQHFAEEAKKAKKPRQEVEAEFAKVKEPTDKDVKDWYEKNKSKIPPYPFEQIKDQIKGVVKEEAIGAKRTKLLGELKKKGAFAFVAAEPTAPTIQIATDGFAAKGPAAAKVTVVEFADYQCPHCKEANATLRKVYPKFKDQVRFVYADFPINRSGISTIVAQGAYCANEQGKFWEYHDMAFDKQATLTKESPAALAKDLKLDEKKFGDCLAGAGAKAHVEKGKAEGERIGVNGTPAIYVNGKKYMGGHSEADMMEMLQKAVKG